MLASRVAAQQLPPVGDRLPDEPAVVEPLDKIGKYGGTWRRLAITPDDSLLGNRLGYEPLVRWDKTGTTPIPCVAKRWEIEDGGQRYILYLHKGIKWSDGQPFSSEDVRYCIEEVLSNPELGGRYVALAPKDTVVRVLAPDPEILVFEFDKPNAIFLEKLCYLGHGIYQPKHYLKQFHHNYADPEQLDRMVSEEHLDHWTQLYLNKADSHINPDLPTITAWQIKIGPPAMMYEAERNPYYWKVDPAGNQLPYIDRISFQVADSSEVLNLIACTGEIDMQGRHIDSSKYSFFMSPENRKRGGIVRYNVLADASSGGNAGIILNLSTQNQKLKPYLTDKRFRVAMSLAINRDELIELTAGGIGDICNGVGFPADPYFQPGVDQQHARYDPDRANELLDAVGLKRGHDGVRRYPNGEPFREIMYCQSWGTAGALEMEQLAVQYWREIGRNFVIKAEATEISRMRVRNGETDFWFAGNAGLHWILQPALYVPVKQQAAFAPHYGTYIETQGQAGIPPTPEMQQLVDWYYGLIHAMEAPHRLQLGRNILRQWSDECYMIGLYRVYALTIVSSRFRNCPDSFLHGWRVQSPGYTNPEQYYIESLQHSVQVEVGNHGTVYPSGRFQVYDGMEQEFKLTPEEGFMVTDLHVNGESVGAVDSYRIDEVVRDITVKATFAPFAQ